MKTKQFFKSQLFLLIVLIFFSCGRDAEDEAFVTYNLDQVNSSTDLKLSDLLENTKLVKLALHDDYPVSERMIQWVGNKYILLVSRKNVLQYSSDGEFIRELIHNGGGPEEYSEVDYFDVDESKEIMYFYDHGFVGRIRRIDLNTGELLSAIPLPDDERWFLAGFVVYQGRLLCFTNNYSPVAYRYFFIDDNGNAGFGCNKKPFLGERPGVSIAPYLSETEGRVNFRQVRDTLFMLQDDSLVIEMIIREDNYFSPGEDKTRGFSTTIAYNSKRYILVRSYDLEMIPVDGSGIRLENHGTRLLLIDREEETVANISEINIDYLGVNSEDPEIYQNDNKAWIVISAIKLIDYLDSALEKEDIEPELRSRLLALNEEVKEDDNPYLLIGTMR